MKPNERSEYQQDQIERYLKGQMTAPEQQTFEQQMEADASLTQAVEDTRVFLLAMENEEGLSADLKDSWQKLQAIRANTEVDWEKADNQKTSLSAGRSNLLRWGKWAAVVILMLGGATYWSFFSSQQDLLETYYEKPPNTLVFEQRGTDAGDKPEPVQTIMEQYENGEYQAALTRTNEYLREHEHSELTFYKGIMLLEMDKPEKAIQVFQRLQGDQPEPEAKVLWYGALAYLANDQKAKAKEQLQRLIQSSAPRYHTDAQNLLQKLDSPD